VSERNGDKARFGRERKRRILERKRIRELRKWLEDNPRRTALAISGQDSTVSLTLAPNWPESVRLASIELNAPCNRKVSSPLKEDS
jgi:hypothetical protein